MVLSLGGGEGRARASAEDNGSPGHFIKGPKTYNESNSLLHSICDFEFVYGLMVLKLILSNTDNLSRYLQ